MPITLNCPKCHKPFRVRDESIGGRVRCPSCGSVLQVPAALSPASYFGDGPKVEGAGDPDKPEAEDVIGRSYAGTMPEVALGGAPRRDEAVDLGPPPGAPLPGPPSIKARVPTPAGPSILPNRPAERPAPAPPPSFSAAPAPLTGRQSLTPTRPMSDDEVVWLKVKGGLGMIRMGLFLFALLILAFFGHGVWIVFDYERAMSDDPGLLKRADWPLWKEVVVAYTAGLTVPAILLLLVGRLRCGGAPSAANARGLALGSAFFTLVAIAGLALYAGMTYFNLGPKLQLPDKARLTALYAAVPAAVLADVLTLLFIGQIGWPLRRPQLQKSVASFFVYVALLPAGVLIGLQYYSVPSIWPIRDLIELAGTPHVEGEDDLAKRALIWMVILLAAAVMFFLRYAGVAGRGRRAIRKMLAGEA